jgi:hypothetical protein
MTVAGNLSDAPASPVENRNVVFDGAVSPLRAGRGQAVPTDPRCQLDIDPNVTRSGSEKLRKCLPILVQSQCAMRCAQRSEA